jgi:hypothetical protein
VKLKDFGIYRLYKSRSSPGESASIGLDLAPELRDGQAPDERTDLYGLGLMIQRLVAKSPAAAETADLRSAILEISKRLLKLAPDERYQSAGEVLIALRDCPQPSPQAWRRDQLGSWARKMFDSGLGEKEEPVNNENPADPGSHVEKVGLLDPAVFWGAVEPTGSAAAPDRIEAQEFAPASESPESGVVEYSDPDMQFEDDTEEVSSLQIPAPSPSPPEPRKPPEVLPVAPPPAPPAQVKTRQTGMRPSSRPVKKPARGGGPGGAMWAMIAFVVLGVGGLLFLFLGQKTSRNADDDSGELVVEQAQKEPGGGQTAGETRPVPDRKTSKENKVPELSGLRKGSLRLTSDPSGVAVFIDGEKRGATPTELKEITLGSTITVRMELEGYRPWEQKIEFDHEDPDREIHAGLVRKIKCDKGSGWIYISTNPAGAVVEMDGKRLPGKTPMVVNDVCAGVNHNYRVKLAGYKTWWRDATVSPSQVLNMKVELSK